MPGTPVCAKARRFIYALCAKLCILLLTLMLLIVALQVLCRNVMHLAMPWAEEATVYMMIALGLFGSVFVIMEKGQLYVELLVARLNFYAQRIVRIVILIVQIAFMAAIVWFSRGSLEHASHVEAISLGISMFIPYLAIPVAFSLMAVELVFQVADAVIEMVQKRR